MPIQNAQYLWIHAGRMSGADPRNQIEFPDYIARFFDDHSRTTEIVRIRVAGGQAIPRPLTYRGDDYGQWTADIWRLGLPTAHMGGPPYVGRVVRFQRSQDAAGPFYQVDVADVGSPEAAAWRHSTPPGQLNQTGDTGQALGREFGYY